MDNRFKLISALAVIYVSTIILGNWLASEYVWPVGFGYKAPAGVFAIGLTLGLRDWLHEEAGLKWTVVLMYFAGVASWIISSVMGWSGIRDIAIASVVAFTVSETVDTIVFHPFRISYPEIGVAVSNLFGLVVDSYIFLQLAFGDLTFFRGQVIGKAEMIIVAVILIYLRKRLFGKFNDGLKPVER